MKNNSPWIFELNTNRKTQKLTKDIKTNVAIVGAGIAGVATAFFTLENTKKNVVLIDKYKLAHGATGHNAGQVVAYFERPLPDIAREYGLQMATEGQNALNFGWELLDHMYNVAKMSISFNKFTGRVGFARKEDILEKLEAEYLLKEGKVENRDIFIFKNVSWLSEIPKKYDGLYKLCEKEEINDFLETKDEEYVAYLANKVGCINSALFSEKILEYLLAKYPERFNFFENTPINKLALHKDFAILDAEVHTIISDKVILCTNGFENLEIFNCSLDVDQKFHRNVSGTIGYMSAFLEKRGTVPFAAAYFRETKDGKKEPYFYVTRRKYDFDEYSGINLSCVGGPEIDLEDRKDYIYDYEYPEDAKNEIENFVEKTYGVAEEERVKHAFLWHGLMGYTENRLRLIGEEPKNKILLYNLGCNGVGILPSIYGGYKISKILAGENFPPSIFDPK